jgi:Protein of unknown function (DUF1244)
MSTAAITSAVATAPVTSSSASLLMAQKHPHPFLLQLESQQQPQQQQQLQPLEKLQAGAFRSLIQHLQYYSNDISNIDLMTMAGFCRNCLAKVRTVV